MLPMSSSSRIHSYGVNRKNRLNRTHWETMFHTSELPCIQHRTNFPNGYTTNPCSVSATIGIRHSDLDGRARSIILSKFCSMMSHIEVLVSARNTVFAHATKGELADEDFRQLWNELENSIICVSNITSTADSRKESILDLKEKSLEEAMCLELQCACCKIQDTVEIVKESIDLKLQQIKLQIKEFTSNMADVVRNELSVQLNDYSVYQRIQRITRYIKRYGCEVFVNNFNEKLAEWFRSEENVAIFKWPLIAYFIRPTSLTIEKGTFYKKHAEWFQSEESVANCEWPVINYFIRPTSFTIKNGQIGTVTNDGWLIKNLIDLLTKPESFKYSVDRIEQIIKEYIKEYGCQEFINSFNEKHAEWFQSEENVAKCKWPVIDYFLRPKSFTIKNGKIGTVINDDWLIQRLIHILMKLESYTHSDISYNTCTSVMDIYRYLKMYGCEEFFNNFNKKLAEWFQSVENVANCKWPVINSFIRPTSFTIENGKIGTVINDDWLIQRLIHILMTLESYTHSDISYNTSVMDIYRYLKMYGGYEFINRFGKKFAEWFQSEEKVANCKWPVIINFIRPTSFTIENGKIGTVINDDWLIQRLIHILMKLESYTHSDISYNTSVMDIYRYLKMYGGYEFINLFGEKLAEWFQTEEKGEKCEWSVIDCFIRPTSFTVENGQIGTVTNEGWLIQRLIHLLMTPTSSKHSVDRRALDIKEYITKYGGYEFVNRFREKLAEWFQTEEKVANCEWPVIDCFIRPTSFKIENGQIVTVTNDDWLIQRIIHILMKPEPSADPVYDIAWSIERYIAKFGGEEFVNSFTKKHAEWFQSEESVANCEWPVIDYFIRPTSFTIKNGQIGTFIKDGWLIKKLIHLLTNIIESFYMFKFPVDRRAEQIIKEYIKRYGCQDFINSFNQKLAEWLQSKKKCSKM
ncbi:unnamed protein product [Mytilus edulis]|uniref:Uncharacterized protein n=1 Tax=Mytilus edulis TaxID=6550 RepID=A0A8S3USE9_MYTED|nr:unnamed protein product [Mytilus edulis]